ncbi:hypothetical protein M2S00_07300 [Apilactobacillus sp. TMW 2.2459]|uniref:hypothetical protein n=1 Tax=Apilactobacillus xinyiensis TaxID=2841032 RepID=UPI002010AE58|nr:hypothetical protein [Apilactobacillus xinyiensis]MCL0312912.1 hypothetical protein [Apilactobacillus xinyiensis]
MDNDINWSLVKQMYEMLSKTRELSIGLEELYKYMVRFNMIDRFGNPTKFSIENGLIE